MLVAARALVYAALLPAAGLPIYLLSAGCGIAVTGRIRSAMAGLAAIAAGASVWWGLASVSAMTATSLAVLDWATIDAVLRATPLGLVLVIRLLALAGLVVAALALRSRGFVVTALGLGCIALATCAWAGHAGASEGALGMLHRLADVAHLFAAGTWLAALGMLAGLAFGSADEGELAKRLARFATAGTVIVATLFVSGIINGLAITGWPITSGTWHSGWLALLAVKLAGFAAMLALAAMNRWRLTPALARGQAGATVRLRRSLVIETGLGLGVIALVAVLGLFDPAA